MVVKVQFCFLLLVVNDLFVYLEALPEHKKTFTDKELKALKLKYEVR